MSLWCNVEDVNGELGQQPGSNYDAQNILDEIPKSVTAMIMALSGKINSTVYVLWDESLDNVPPAIRDLCAKLTGAKVLVKFTPGESIADGASKAGSLYKEYKDGILSIHRDAAFLQTSPTDTNPLPTTKVPIVSTRSIEDQDFTRDKLGNY